jgi:predicted kinase
MLRTTAIGKLRAEPESRYTQKGSAQAPTLFLMVGLPGAGKTVRARELAAERGALVLTPDAWMIALFGQSQPDGKRDLLEGRLIALAIEVLRLRLSVVLDFGLWGRDERSALRWIAASAGASCQVIYLPVDREVQLSRVQGRWERTPEQTFSMTEAELEAWRSQFDVPDDAELSNSSLPSPPPGDEGWLAWAERRWPSLRQGVEQAPHHAMIARRVTS